MNLNKLRISTPTSPQRKPRIQKRIIKNLLNRQGMMMGGPHHGKKVPPLVLDSNDEYYLVDKTIYHRIEFYWGIVTVIRYVHINEEKLRRDNF